MSGYVSLFFDVILLAAFAATIFFSLRLSRQFASMQADRKAFEALIQALGTAAGKSEAAVGALKTTAIESADILQEKINSGRDLAAELEIMIQAGDNLADRLQSAAEKGARARPDAVPSGDAPLKTADAPPVKSRAERELIEALKAKQKT